MKEVILLITLFVFFGRSNAQITYDATYTLDNAVHLDKFHLSGYKYVEADIPNLKIKIYNINHSLFKTINIPPQPLTIKSVAYVSEQLFDTDTLIEYALNCNQFYSGPPGYVLSNFSIYKENGNLVMYKDSANMPYTGYNNSGNDIFDNFSGVYFDGLNTKMQLAVCGPVGYAFTRTRVYTLPGTIPCSQCGSTGTVMGRPSISNPGPANPIFWPNPVTDQLKLKYELPKDHKNADIKIYDLQGKLIETFKVTDTFDFIYLPSDYNNGLYLYSLNVDGKTIKTEKIILNK
jgi:hypothetical protein